MSEPRIRLDISDLSEVKFALSRHSFPGLKYAHLGLSLGLYPTTLDIIRAENFHNIDRCLLECLTVWLRRVDNVESRGVPSYYTLIAALRAIGENAVADGIGREKYLTVYDGSGLNITDGEHAIKILNRHKKRLSQLRDPVSVAIFVREEGVAISEETMRDITNLEHPLEDRASYLLGDVRKAVKQDYTKLRVFANVCEKVTGNEDIGQAILIDYDAFFKTENPTSKGIELGHTPVQDKQKPESHSFPPVQSFEELLSGRPKLSELTEHVITHKWYLLGLLLKCDTNSLDELEMKNESDVYKTTKIPAKKSYKILTMILCQIRCKILPRL